jgi:hypothetical protein
MLLFFIILSWKKYSMWLCSHGHDKFRPSVSCAWGHTLSSVRRRGVTSFNVRDEIWNPHSHHSKNASFDFVLRMNTISTLYVLIDALSTDIWKKRFQQRLFWSSLKEALKRTFSESFGGGIHREKRVRVRGGYIAVSQCGISWRWGE